MRKIFAVILILSMLMGMTVTAMAATDGKVTITDTVPNITYKLYKMLNVTIEGTDPDFIYYYQPADGWEEFFSNHGEGELYLGTLASSGYIAVTNTKIFSADSTTAGAEAAALATSAGKYIATKGLTPLQTKTTESTSISFNDLDTNAYYIVVSSIGQAVMAGPVTDAEDFTIHEKNNAGEVPTVVKTVGPNDQPYMSVDVGSEFGYKISIVINKDIAAGTVAEPSMVLDDTMPRYLQVIADSLKITLDGVELTKDTDYTYVQNSKTSDETVTNTVKFIRGFSTGQQILFTYDALLGNAEIGGVEKNPVARDMYTNIVTLTYEGATITDTASVFTLTPTGTKFYKADNGAETVLEGATFVLKNAENKYYSFADGKVSWVNDIGAATPKVSDELGKFSFYGIASGTYTLVETAAPEGFVGAGDTEITVDRDMTDVKVENIKAVGGLLPSTGGTGTTMLYLVGAVLILGAGVMMVARKKQSEEE